MPADLACPGAGLLRCSDLRVGRGKDGYHRARLVIVVADGVAGPRPDEDRVAGPRGLWLAIDGDGAFAGDDQQDLFDLVGVLGDLFTAGEGVDEDVSDLKRRGLPDSRMAHLDHWKEPTQANRDAIRSMLQPETTVWQYTHGVPDPSLVSPDGYTLDNHYLARPPRVWEQRLAENPQIATERRQVGRGTLGASIPAVHV